MPLAEIPAGSALEFAVLGELEVRRDETKLRLDGERARALLSYLIANANRALSSDELIEAVWRNRSLRDPQNVLHASVSRVRALLGDQALETTPGGYRLVLEPERLDASRFEELVSRGKSALAADDSRSAASAFTGALELWRGRPYSDLTFSDVVDGEIRRLEELHMAAVEGRAEALLRLGEGPELVAELTALVKAHPLSERLRSQLAVSLYRAGRQGEALQACRAARRMLRTELGLDPTPTLREVELAILRHDESLEHRSTTRPPLPPNALLGREVELERALALLSREDVRLLTLTGAGGIGKTRLALELAAELGGAVFVDLAEVLDPSLVSSAIAAALGLRQWSGQSVVDALQQHLRDRKTLLLLDSFEHVIDQSPLVAKLIGAAPGLKVLVTSRARLRVAAEHEYELGPLGTDAAIDLFRARAAAVDPDYTVGTEEERAVQDICRRLDGLPLAIELAAARTNLLSPQALHEQLLGGFDVLFAGRRDAPARHQTLRATMNWSWALLEDEERVAFQGLGVFVGGFTAEAARAVLGERGSLPVIGSLADKSLVEREPENRFRLLDTVREYALHRLAESAEEEKARHLRHAVYYTELVEAVDAELRGPRAKELFRRLELEHGNIRAAFAFAIGAGEGELGLRLALASRRFWYLRGHLAEGFSALTLALEAAPDGDPNMRARVLNSAGIIAAEQGAYDAARRSFLESARLARQIGSRERLACVLGNLARLAMFDGKYDGAREVLEEAVRMEADDPYVTAVALENLALVALAEDDREAALELATGACAAARTAPDEQVFGDASLILGRVHLERGELGAAASALGASLSAKLDIDERAGMAECLELVGELCAARGQAGTAAALFGAAATARELVGAARTPDVEASYVRFAAIARQALGESAFKCMFDEGARLEFPDAVAQALGALAPLTATAGA